LLAYEDTKADLALVLWNELPETGVIPCFFNQLPNCCSERDFVGVICWIAKDNNQPPAGMTGHIVLFELGSSMGGSK
jgi:hypothetical protein